ncbi:hypothetical protein OPV22_030852 [Ensete ventricosum]|uniref:Methyltransferase n=1 Tax=Ensete ventricosum TaxID=4639 RepID=A0AAV8P0U1_ENSVE|nr:hypothetical protein OPV22_030852 [Ensete ventricosum]
MWDPTHTFALRFSKCQDPTIKRVVMFQQSSSRNSQNRGSKVKRLLQMALLLSVVVWLVNRVNKNEYAGGDQMNLYQEDDVDFGRKGKAGSENVIIIEDQGTNSDETPETSEAGDQVDSSDQHTEDKNNESSNKEQGKSVQVISNTSQTETQEERLSDKDDNVDSITNSRDSARSNDMSADKEDMLQLPSERSSKNVLDQNDGENIEQIPVQQNKPAAQDQTKHDTGEAITSDEERPLNSKNELKGCFEVEKEAIDLDGGVQSDTEGSGSNSLEDTTNSANSGDSSISLSKEEKGISTDDISTEKNTFDSQGDISTDAETTGHHTLETVSSDEKTEGEAVNLPGSTEEKELMMPTNSEVPKGEAVEYKDNSNLESEATGNSPLVEETSTESDDKPTVTSVVVDIKDVELPDANEALERDAVESSGDNASDAGSNNAKEEKMDSRSSEDAPESKGDGASDTQDAGRNDAQEEKTESFANEDASERKGDDTSEVQDAGDKSSLGTSSETKPTEEAENSSRNNEDNSEIPTDEIVNVAAEESQGNDSSKEEENTSNTVFEDTTETNPKEETTSGLGKEKADSEKEGGKELE